MDAYERVIALLDARTVEILEHRRRTAVRKGRGWLMRRMLLASDLLGLALAFVVAELVFAGRGLHSESLSDSLLFAISLPLWRLSGIS